MSAPDTEHASSARRQYRWIACALVGAAIVSVAKYMLAPCGTRITAVEFSPQAGESRENLTWAASRPGEAERMMLLACRVEGERTRAPLRISGNTPPRIWVAVPRWTEPAVDFALADGDREIPLRADLRSVARTPSVDWVPLIYDAAPTSRDLSIIATARPARARDENAVFGELLVNPRLPGKYFPPSVNEPLRLWRVIGAALLLACMPGLTRSDVPVAGRIAFCLGLAAFVDYYLVTAGWGWSDDDWHMMPHQSGLLDGDLAALLKSHNGHILPVYRVIRHLCYMIEGANGIVIRAVNAASTVAAAFMLRWLLRRWTGSSLAGYAAAAIYLSNYNLHDQSLNIVAANNFQFAATGVIAAICCCDRALEGGSRLWIAFTALSALCGSLCCGARVVVFACLPLQWLLHRADGPIARERSVGIAISNCAAGRVGRSIYSAWRRTATRSAIPARRNLDPRRPQRHRRRPRLNFSASNCACRKSTSGLDRNAVPPTIAARCAARLRFVRRRRGLRRVA